MLILTRGAGETITIGHNMRVTILSVKGSQIRIGIEVPNDVRVLREEIVDSKVKQATEEA